MRSSANALKHHIQWKYSNNSDADSMITNWGHIINEIFPYITNNNANISLV